MYCIVCWRDILCKGSWFVILNVSLDFFALSSLSPFFTGMLFLQSYTLSFLAISVLAKIWHQLLMAWMSSWLAFVKNYATLVGKDRWTSTGTRTSCWPVRHSTILVYILALMKVRKTPFPHGYIVWPKPGRTGLNWTKCTGTVSYLSGSSVFGRFGIPDHFSELNRNRYGSVCPKLDSLGRFRNPYL